MATWSKNGRLVADSFACHLSMFARVTSERGGVAEKINLFLRRGVITIVFPGVDSVFQSDVH